MPKHLPTLLAVAALAGPAGASELVYTPVNPSFGGSPLNGSWLLGNAQAQDRHKDPDSSLNGSLNKTPLQEFNDILERSVLGQLASAATAGVISNGRLVPGTVETGNFTISISDLGGGQLRVRTTDKVTGAVSSFEVGQ
ncbi:MAG: curli assembly protein CsgF [Comamonadaceae bacterium]|nr:MAG: curli assembly protein CsgF [Comamonadaceae bacterium]